MQNSICVRVAWTNKKEISDCAHVKTGLKKDITSGSADIRNWLNTQAIAQKYFCNFFVRQNINVALPWVYPIHFILITIVLLLWPPPWRRHYVFAAAFCQSVCPFVCLSGFRICLVCFLSHQQLDDCFRRSVTVVVNIIHNCSHCKDLTFRVFLRSCSPIQP